MNFRSLSLAIAFAAQSALADGLPDLGESARQDLSPQMERRLGESIMQDIRWRDPSFVDDPEISSYLGQIGARLVAANPAADVTFEFFAIRDPSLNAFALPGGHIGVHTGLIVAAQSESELAGVLAHEIAHVSQHHIARMVGKQKDASLIAVAAAVVAILAARSNSQMSEAALAGGAAAGIQSQLNYSREFEREADRMGLQTMETAGFDVRGMAGFFERLQRHTRLYENNAPAYLRTHPLTTERIADMENRLQSLARRQTADSLEFRLVRAKLQVQRLAPRDAVAEMETAQRENRSGDDPALRYGLARAYLADRDVAAAQQQLAALRRGKVSSPMVETLAAELRAAQSDGAGVLQTLREARARFPGNPAINYALVNALMASGTPAEAQKVVEEELRVRPGDSRLHELRARSYAAQGRRAQSHRAQAEVYVLRGQLAGAIEQLELAQRSGDGDFYELSAVDSRLREVRVKYALELRRKREEGGR